MNEQRGDNGAGETTGEPLEIEYLDVDAEGGKESGSRDLEPVGAPGAASPEGASSSEGTGETGTGEDELDRLRGELEHLRELYLRKLAEFDNFRKRVERERDDVRINAAADVIRELVPVMDNFDRALAHADANPESLRQGVDMIARQLWDALIRQGLEVVDPEGRMFDPEVHEAVQRVEDPSHEPGTVVRVLGKGYLFRGRLVRPAMVAVAVEPRDVFPSDGPETKGGDGS